MDDYIIRGGPRAGAAFSPDERYRYLLWREWDSQKPTCVFIMLNPSTADERVLDPTVRRCLGYAKAWGFGQLTVLNIFALRSTDPAALWMADDPVGPRNNQTILEAVQGTTRVICAWGVHGALRERGAEVARLLDRYSLKCLGKTKHGYPKHPLYLPKNASIIDL